MHLGLDLLEGGWVHFLVLNGHHKTSQGEVYQLYTAAGIAVGCDYGVEEIDG